MNETEIWALKKVPWDRYLPGSSMKEIVQDGFKQRKLYATETRKFYPQKRIIVHVALSVGTRRILYQSYSNWDTI